MASTKAKLVFDFGPMTVEELIEEIKISIKRKDVQRWRIGDALRSKGGIDETTLNSIAKAVDLKRSTLERYAKTATEFPTDEWREKASYGILEILAKVAPEDRDEIFNSRPVDQWNLPAMKFAVSEYTTKKATEKINVIRKRDGKGEIKPRTPKNVDRSGMKVGGFVVQGSWVEEDGRMRLLIQAGGELELIRAEDTGEGLEIVLIDTTKNDD